MARPELAVDEPADRACPVLVDLDDESALARSRLELGKGPLLQISSETLAPRGRADRGQHLRERTRLALALEPEDLHRAQVKLDGASDPRPVLDLAGDRPLA